MGKPSEMTYRPEWLNKPVQMSQAAQAVSIAHAPTALSKILRFAVDSRPKLVMGMMAVACFSRLLPRS